MKYGWCLLSAGLNTGLGMKEVHETLFCHGMHVQSCFVLCLALMLSGCPLGAWWFSGSEKVLDLIAAGNQASPPPLIARATPLSEQQVLFPKLLKPWNLAVPFSGCLCRSCFFCGLGLGMVF